MNQQNDNVNKYYGSKIGGWLYLILYIIFVGAFQVLLVFQDLREYSSSIGIMLSLDNIREHLPDYVFNPKSYKCRIRYKDC